MGVRVRLHKGVYYVFVNLAGRRKAHKEFIVAKRAPGGSVRSPARGSRPSTSGSS
jgi:hypothetical protein